MGHSLVLHPTSQSQAGTYLGGRQNGKFPIVYIFCLSIEILDSYRRKSEFLTFICFPSKKLSISRCRINNLFTPLCLSFFLIFICTETFHLRSHYVRSKLPRTKDSFDSCLLLHLFRGAAFVGNTFGHFDDFDGISGKKNVAERCTHFFYR